MIGQRLSHYEVIERLGEGGMGTVYRALDSRLGRPVAIKVLRLEAMGDEDRKRRFKQEARAASALNHPNIVTIHDIGSEAGVDFIVMEYVAGAPLHRLIPPGGMSLEQALDYAVQITSALAAAHAAGILHRDIKPANIVVSPDGRAKVLDFGLAKLTERPVPSDEASTDTAPPQTQRGGFLGTAGYAAPEQVEGKAADARSDIFAIGVVLYELLAGRRVFLRDSHGSSLAAVLHDTPTPLGAIRRDVPSELERIVFRCLEKQPGARYHSAAELLRDLAALRSRVAGQPGRLARAVRRPAVAASVLVILAALIVATAASLNARARVRNARAVVVPEIARQIQHGKPFAAFRLIREVESLLPDDPYLEELRGESLATVSIRTAPSGAEVRVQDFFDEPDRWVYVGRTPIQKVSLPVELMRVRVSKQGFGTKDAVVFNGPPSMAFTLQPATSTPPGMVHVPGGPHELFSTQPVVLEDYWIDTYEVTNRQFKEFVDRGGYDRTESWPRPLVNGGRVVVWEGARRGFRDRTGRVGPATWEFGTYPEGHADFPVAGVSWYEAAAYCVSVNKELPTLYHWYRAAALGMATQLVSYSNFEGAGPQRVGGRLRMGPLGTYDMAGNVKEWCWNEADGGRRYILGGGWNEPSYMFDNPDAQAASERPPTSGFRCARYRSEPPAFLRARSESLRRDFRREKPASDEAFEVYRGLYRYDRGELEARVESVDDQPEHWQIEKASFNAAYGSERVPVILFLPKNADPPYQTVVWMPGAGVFFEPSSSARAVSAAARWFYFVIRSGRALLFPIYKGSYERNVGNPFAQPNIWRDTVIAWAKDVGRSIDYLETRGDIDAGRLAYYGLSTGAGVGPIMTAVEPRFRASVLLGGGLQSWRRPPESEAFHFARHVKVPTLMINGRHDFFFPLETSQAPLFQLLGTPSADKRHRVFQSGHVPTEKEEVVKEILDWLDRYLGPVAQRGARH